MLDVVDSHSFVASADIVVGHVVLALRRQEIITVFPRLLYGVVPSS